MSLRGKDFRCELDPDLHERLRVMAEFHDLDIASFGSRLLEKAVCGEWHECTVLMERAARCGIARKAAEDGGKRK
jgi:hypothetical protein